MPRYIMKLDGKYLEWSTVIDAPTTFGMTREELAQWHKEEVGEEGFRKDFEERMARVEACGLSTSRTSRGPLARTTTKVFRLSTPK